MHASWSLGHGVDSSPHGIRGLRDGIDDATQDHGMGSHQPHSAAHRRAAAATLLHILRIEHEELMKLIAINIGLQKGIITKELFAALVIMAVVTTLMASPVFGLVMGDSRHALEPET